MEDAPHLAKTAEFSGIALPGVDQTNFNGQVPADWQAPPGFWGRGSFLIAGIVWDLKFHTPHNYCGQLPGMNTVESGRGNPLSMKLPQKLP